MCGWGNCPLLPAARAVLAKPQPCAAVVGSQRQTRTGPARSWPQGLCTDLRGSQTTGLFVEPVLGERQAAFEDVKGKPVIMAWYLTAALSLSKRWTFNWGQPLSVGTPCPSVSWAVEVTIAQASLPWPVKGPLGPWGPAWTRALFQVSRAG